MAGITIPDAAARVSDRLRRALPPALQREQARNAEVDEIVSLDAGHSAFASRPKELADLLLCYA
jgi:hypothetical protein